MEISLENLTSIVLAIVGIVSLVLSYISNRETLQQSEKNIKTQLFYEDRKKAIFRLNKILEESDYFQVKHLLIDFLKSPQGQYLPPNVKNSVFNKIKEIDKLIEEKGYDKALEENQPILSEEEKLELIEKEMIRQQDPEEWVKDRLEEKFTLFKKGLKDMSQKKLNDLDD